jgi:hypothetical protein
MGLKPFYIFHLTPSREMVISFLHLLEENQGEEESAWWGERRCFSEKDEGKKKSKPKPCIVEAP